MPNWAEILKEQASLGSPFDILRRKYIKQLHEHTNRNVISYYSGFLQKPGGSCSIGDVDKTGLMTAVNGLDVNLGLDLILHTPGGDIAATESIVDYLFKKFGNDIRCFVPHLAMSAGTMIACSCREIWMGKQSSLGPVDPQLGGVAAHGVVEELKNAYDDICNNPKSIPYWQVIIAKYTPTFAGECEKAIKWSNSLVESWLRRNMLADNQNQIPAILKEITDHSVSLAHNRHLSAEKCSQIGLKIMELESDQELQDKVLSLHHIYCHTFSSTSACKIIENHNGHAYIMQTPQNLGLNRVNLINSEFGSNEVVKVFKDPSKEE